MPSVFLYEFLTAGGCYSFGDDPPAGSLLAEGAAMRDTLAADFAASSLVDTVHLLHDVRLPEPIIAKQTMHRVYSRDTERRLFQRLASDADYTVLIAPEFSACLETRARWAVQAGGKLLSPDAEFIRLAADKQQTAEYLAERGIPVPRGIQFGHRWPPAIEDTLFPAVLKPLDGAGSTNVRLIQSRDALRTADLSVESSWRLEQHCPGLAASISYLAGPHGVIMLPACSQRLSNDGTFQYQGGVTPLAPSLAERAMNLGSRVAAALPSTTRRRASGFTPDVTGRTRGPTYVSGYVGIDIVLGPADNGSEDFVIEVNPRLTTSYLGLRQACQQNLAEAMLRWALGERVELSFHPQTISFAASQRS